MNIGLIGYGSVGKAFIKLLSEKHINCRVKFILRSNSAFINTNGIDLKSIREEDFIEGITFSDVIKEKIDYLIELSPTNIETGEPALSYIKEALNNKINVVTGNKGPVLAAYDELKSMAENNKVSFGIGCTVGGALPSLDTAEYGLNGSEILEIQGVLNGTSNYILKEMLNNKQEYREVLKKAIEDGIAESNPELDVSGYDTAIKIIILSKVLMDSKVSLKDADITGINNIKLCDLERAALENKKIKLVGKVFYNNGNVNVLVRPEVIDENHPLYFIEGKNKGVFYKTDILGDVVVSGGASSPKNAAAAILRDIMNTWGGRSMNKREIRDDILSKRDGMMQSEKDLYDEKILRYLKDTTEYKSAENIFIYVGYKSEINTAKYIKEFLEEGKNILIPRTNYTGKFMEAVQIKSLEGLEKDKFGILQPGFNKKASSKDKIDLVILPGVAFDKDGGRVGYGGGYYDKYLANMKTETPKIALCYYMQIIDRVPMEDYDVRADKIITEEGVIL